MTIETVGQTFSVCRLADLSGVDFTDDFCFVGKTNEELSLVCDSRRVPPAALACDGGWRAFRVGGVLEFSMVGVLSQLTAVLAREQISVFAVSTYNTDYILTKQENFDRALAALRAAGYEVA